MGALTKRVLRHKKRHHTSLVQKICRNLSSLNIDGLSSETVLFLERDPSFRYKGELMIPDMFLLYFSLPRQPRYYHLLLLDVKAEPSNISADRGRANLRMLGDYLKEAWRKEIEKRKDEILSRRDHGSKGTVILSTGIVSRPPFTYEIKKDWILYRHPLGGMYFRNGRILCYDLDIFNL